MFILKVADLKTNVNGSKNPTRVIYHKSGIDFYIEVPSKEKSPQERVRALRAKELKKYNLQWLVRHFLRHSTRWLYCCFEICR